jgi:TonB-dependent starch-binding outer membrane protein SusC
MKLLTDGLRTVRTAVSCRGSAQLVKVMKITGFLLVVALCHVSAAGFSQQVTLSLKDAPIEKVFREIERQTGYGFLYNKKMLADLPTVTLHVKNADIKEVLDQCFRSEQIEYVISEQTILIREKIQAVKESVRANTPPSGEVTGNITDESGQPLAGATIKLKNGKILGLSDEKGDFKLKNVAANAVIEISFTGYGVAEIQVNGQSALKISLKRANNKLDDVQVIAYGTTTQRLNTGNVTTVTSREIEEQPVSNPLAALEGRVPGLVVTQATGAPGGGFTVQIRGQNSIANGNAPFYVVDGVPYPSVAFGASQNETLQSGKGGSALNFLNPADIESIEVLKDADATSIYGSQAANGAILITTKKGKPGRMNINLNTYTGFGEVTRNPHLLNNQQYLNMRHEAFANDGATPSPNYDYDLTFWDTTRYTNWEKVLLGNTAHYDDAQASVSGGTVNTQYLVGGGYHRETAVFPVILPGQGEDQKGSAHANLTTASDNKKFKLGLNVQYSSDANTVQPNDFTGIAYTLLPDAPPIFNSEGKLNWAPLSPGQLGTWTNPFSGLYQTWKATTANLVSNATVSYTLLPGLEIKTSLGYTSQVTNALLTAPSTSLDPGIPNAVQYASSTFVTTNFHSWIAEPQLNYRLNLGKAGILSALAGSTFRDDNSNYQQISAFGFVSDGLLGNLASASRFTPSSSGYDYKYNALFGRLNYNWQDKYLVTLSGRRDGSSRFGPGKQFADFGAVGAAWIFSGEGFFKKHVSFLSFGKLRASYGTSGSDQIANYDFLNLYNTNSYPYQGIQTLSPASLFNPDLAWEVDKKLEGGLELGFLKDRISTTISVYRSRSGNQLISTPLSEVTGFGAIPANLPALVQNSGLELVFNTTNIRSKNFRWTSSMNLTVPRNKLLAYPNFINSSYANTLVIGQPLTIQKVYHLLGVNDTTGVYQFATAKGSPTYNPTPNVDNTSLVNTNPKFYGGFQNRIEYKGISLDFHFQFVKQTGSNFIKYNDSYSTPGVFQNQPSYVLNRWQKPGDIKPYEQFSQNYSGAAYNATQYVVNSDFAYSDASFIRLRNLALSYTLSPNWVHRAHLQDVRIKIQGENLLTITKYRGNDPESQNYFGLPPIRVLTAGIQVNL